MVGFLKQDTRHGGWAPGRAARGLGGFPDSVAGDFNQRDVDRRRSRQPTGWISGQRRQEKPRGVIWFVDNRAPIEACNDCSGLFMYPLV